MHAILLMTGFLGAHLMAQAGRPIATRAATPPPDCGRNGIAEAMRDLFPPAAEAVRARSAEILARCRAVGAEGALSAALKQTSDPRTTVAITSALTTFRTPVAVTALREVAVSNRPAEVRALAMPALVEAGSSDDLVALLGNLREDESARLAALQSLIDGGRPPNAAYLAWLQQHGTPRLAQRAGEMLAPQGTGSVAAGEPPRTTASGSAVPAQEGPPDTTAGLAPGTAGSNGAAPHGGAATSPPPSASPVAAAPPPRPARTGPLDGTPLAIGASTVAGGALMLNLSLLGFQDTTPQLLLGSAGAVIGFGTSWALSRFGVRPTMEQAAWFANVTAWGTLAGITVYQGSGSDNYKMRYFSLIAGEVTGMAAGVWSARRWHWTGAQIAMSDSLFLGAALTALGVDRFQNGTPRVTPALAFAVVPTMVAAAIAGHAFEPTTNDLTLMGASALGAGWLGALMASGGARTELLGSHQGQGGLLLGFGLGYLGGAAAGAFTEVGPLRLQVGAAGMLAGNAIGLGVHMMATGIRRNDDASFAAGDPDSWKLGAGLGGLALGTAAFALAPHLKLGPQALPLTLWGAGYAAGTYWLASAASYHGQPQNETTDAILHGGMLATGVAGGVAGLLLSRRFAPDAVDQWTTFAATGASVAAGWGTAAMLTDNRGSADAIGVTAGAVVGVAGGALFTHSHPRLRPPSVGAAVGGAAYGALFGALLPSLAEPQWRGDRTTGGATMLGLGGGAIAGAALGELTAASAGQVTVPLVAGSLGLGVGAGAGLLWSDNNSQPMRIGIAVSTATFLGGSLLADRWLRLSDGLGATAPGLALVGGGFGALEGAWLAGLLDESGTVSGARGNAVTGGILMGTSAGVAAGLALSKRWAPPGSHLVLAGGNSLLLASAGYGAGELFTDGAGKGNTAATMSGAGVGLVGGALLAPHVRLTAPVVGGALVGAGFGSLVGAVAPSLNEERWIQNAHTDGGLRLGMAAGLLGAGAASQLTGATGRETVAASVAGTLGMGMGLGAGSMWPTDSTQPERIGTVVGVTAVGTAGALLIRPLHLADPLPPRSAGLLVTTTAHGIFDGIWLAALLDPSGLPSNTPAHQTQGGILFGGSLGLTAGLLLAPRLHLDEGNLFFVSGSTLAGASVGRGVALLAADSSGRGDSAATLAGAVVGTAAGTWAAARLDARPVDAGAAIVGAGYGGLIGALVPSLGNARWPGWNRDTTGGLFMGAGAGAAAGVATRIVLHGDEGDVGLTALAGGDGALTGVGWALLLTDDGAQYASPVPGVAPPSSESRHLRLGAAVGTAAGLGLGMASWSRLELGHGDRQMIATSVALAAWNGAWIPALGHGASADFDRRKMGGGFLAAAGTASFASALLAPVVELDADAITDALAVDAVFTGAGAGIGALASNRADAPVVGMLAGGAAGLVLGGALHRSIEFGAAQAPLLNLGGIEGLWAGAWLPYVLRGPGEITDDQRTGGLAAGAFGGLGLSILASTKFAPSGEEVGVAGLASGIGAAIGGGVALMSEDLRDQKAVGLMLAGTGLGLGAGGYLAQRLHIDLRAAGAASLGGVLGTSEALLFAWSSRAEGRDQYMGAGLLGAGVGTALGLATNATMDTTGAGTPAIAGFTAWGAWMGAFAGSLFARDAHEITEGGLIGANVGLLAGYGLLRTGAVDPGDFGWLSLFGAVGTVAGAAVGAPFASQGQPRPILGGLAIGPVLGMVTGALVLPRLRAARDAAATSTVAWRDSRASIFSPFSFFMRGGSAAKTAARGPRQMGAKEAALPTSEEIAHDLQEQHRLRRSIARALDASIKISDCAPLIGALPTADSVASGGTPPMLVGITGRWQ